MNTFLPKVKYGAQDNINVKFGYYLIFLFLKIKIRREMYSNIKKSRKA